MSKEKAMQAQKQIEEMIAMAKQKQIQEEMEMKTIHNMSAEEFQEMIKEALEKEMKQEELEKKKQEKQEKREARKEEVAMKTKRASIRTAYVASKTLRTTGNATEKVFDWAANAMTWTGKTINSGLQFTADKIDDATAERLEKLSDDELDDSIRKIMAAVKKKDK